MQNVHERLRERLNGDAAETFKNRYYGRFFTGDMTLRHGAMVFTLSFHLGDVVAARPGVPITGVDLGVSGETADWDWFADRKSLSVSTTKINPNNLTVQGSPLRIRQNFNALAYVCRVFSEVLETSNEAVEG